MAVARFQIVSVADRARSGAHGFVWRFLSGNNRSLARSGASFPDAESCLVAIRELQRQLAVADAVTSQNGSGQWLWRVRLAEADLAVSSRKYQRRVRARLACDAFVSLAGTVTPAGVVQVVYF